MLEWWNWLSLISRVLAWIAVPATAVMLLQTILLLIGIGGGGDSDFDADGGEVDFDTGIIHNVTSGETYTAAPFPPFIKEIIDANGLLNAIRKKGQQS